MRGVTFYIRSANFYFTLVVKEQNVLNSTVAPFSSSFIRLMNSFLPASTLNCWPFISTIKLLGRCGVSVSTNFMRLENLFEPNPQKLPCGDTWRLFCPPLWHNGVACGSYPMHLWHIVVAFSPCPSHSVNPPMYLNDVIAKMPYITAYLLNQYTRSKRYITSLRRITFLWFFTFLWSGSK